MTFDKAMTDMALEIAALKAKLKELTRDGEAVACHTCNGSGSIWKSLRTGESEYQEWEDDCPDCDAKGTLNVAEIERRTAEACAACVPRSWLDPMLSGPGEVVGDKIDNKTIEAVLMATRDRILARYSS